MRKLTILLILSMMVLVAWSPNHGEAPYTGSFSVSYPSPAQVKSSATSIKWTTAAIADMDGDGNSEYLDQTADCVGSGGDRLGVSYTITNIPNHGVFAYNDCNSNPSVLEEVELHINEDSVVAGTSYYYNVVWLCKAVWTSGEINITFEPTPWSWDWLDKVFYGYPGCQSTALVQSQPVLTSNVPDDVLQERESTQPMFTQQEQADRIHHFENGIFAYEVVRDEYGKLRVHVNVEFENPQIFKAYEAYNREVATALALTEQPSLAVVTFAYPLTVDELRKFTETTEMEVISYGAFGWAQENDATSIHLWPQSKTAEEIPVVENVSVDGIMTITGLINASSLPALVANGKIVLVDVVANQIQSQITSDLGESVELTQIGIPNPAWSFFTDEIGSPTE